MWTKGSGECRNRQKCAEACKDVRKVGNRVAEVGFEYFCLDYVSKNGMSVMEHNTEDYHCVSVSHLFGSPLS